MKMTIIDDEKKALIMSAFHLNQQLLILPGRFQPSTFSVYGLNYCVRYGNRWNPIAIVTGLTGNYLSSQAVSSQVLSAYKGLTTVFGMGTGGSP